MYVQLRAQISDARFGLFCYTELSGVAVFTTVMHHTQAYVQCTLICELKSASQFQESKINDDLNDAVPDYCYMYWLLQSQDTCAHIIS